MINYCMKIVSIIAACHCILANNTFSQNTGYALLPEIGFATTPYHDFLFIAGVSLQKDSNILAYMYDSSIISVTIRPSAGIGIIYGHGSAVIKIKYNNLFYLY